MPVPIRVSLYTGSGLDDPPTIRLDCKSLSFIRKDVALQVGGHNPDRVRYQLAIHPDSRLGQAGVMIRNWIRDHEGVSGCLIRQHSLMIGVRLRRNDSLEPESVALALLDELQKYLAGEVFPRKDLEFSDPQGILYDALIDPAVASP